MGAFNSKHHGSYSVQRNVNSDTESVHPPDGATVQSVNANGKMATGKKVQVHANEEELISALAKLVEKKAEAAIENSGSFKIGVSGGSLPKFLCQGLTTIKTDWSKWIIFFCDERLVSFENPESTYGTYKEYIQDKYNIPITEKQFIKINPSLVVSAAAQDYTFKIAKHFLGDELPRFDMLLLGMGPDGHTCSLFPEHPLLKEQSLWVAAISDSPKPPPSRITFTYPVINNAACVTFVCTGASKADILQKVIEDDDSEIPAALVKPTSGELYWILDKDAAGKLQA